VQRSGRKSKVVEKELRRHREIFDNLHFAAQELIGTHITPWLTSSHINNLVAVQAHISKPNG
jgi:hypothetical protein